VNSLFFLIMMNESSLIPFSKAILTRQKAYNFSLVIPWHEFFLELCFFSHCSLCYLVKILPLRQNDPLIISTPYIFSLFLGGGGGGIGELFHFFAKESQWTDPTLEKMHKGS